MSKYLLASLAILLVGCHAAPAMKRKREDQAQLGIEQVIKNYAPEKHELFVTSLGEYTGSGLLRGCVAACKNESGIYWPLILRATFRAFLERVRRDGCPLQELEKKLLMSGISVLLKRRANYIEHLSVLYNGDSAFIPVLYGPGARLVIACAGNGSVTQLWDNEKGVCLQKDLGSFEVAVFSETEERLLTGSSQNTVKVWDTATGKCLLDIPKYQGAISKEGVWFSGDGSSVFLVSEVSRQEQQKTSGEPFLNEVWDLRSGGKKLRSVYMPTRRQFAMSPDGSFFVCVLDETVFGQEVRRALGRDLKPMSIDPGFPPSFAAFSPGGKELFIASEKADKAKLFKLVYDGQCPGGSEMQTFSGVGKVRSVVFSADGKKLMTVSCPGTQARLWDIGTGLCERTFTCPGTITSIIFSSDSNRATVTCDGKWGPVRRFFQLGAPQTLSDLFSEVLAKNLHLAEFFRKAMQGTYLHELQCSLCLDDVAVKVLCFGLKLPSALDAQEKSEDGQLIALGCNKKVSHVFCTACLARVVEEWNRKQGFKEFPCPLCQKSWNISAVDKKLKE